MHFKGYRSDALLFIARTGCRIGTVFELKMEDVNPETREYKVYSKGKVHHIILTEDLVPMMKRRSHGVGKVFDLKRANQQMMNEYLKRGCKVLGFPKLTVHELRHSKATNMLRQNIPMYTIQKALGIDQFKRQ